ncbi:class I SAM-dependent methyltransferase [Prochlorococcus marinus]|uniref:class I SAM-dependent methyltransferase n=1 Tax=Prochlorococcus marinus TaxID=1219 RepID=UPI001ADC4D5F|nr:class I SAM-dependent methyltransferase [Prochlorococcus marinus]MBO8217688.1 class I SAM-dependent methyltransferase [Prochlorococcus marinus XMU1405]MBW3040851.1 hypothetical protein [Prochlorococcus marinus str. MU1405]MBW3048311.1 hypothetical protein [Prochlorococcus marinus str. MU1406]
MNDFEYHKYLLTRSLIGKTYRNFYLYPRINKYTKGKILDVGCGIGDYLSFNKNAIGTDINKYNIDYLRNKKMHVILMEKDKLPFNNNKFDSILLDNVIEHIISPEKLISELVRVSKNNAYLIVGVPGLKGYKRDPDHKVFYTRDNLNNLFKNYGYASTKTLYFPFRFPFLSANLSSYSIFCVYKLNKNPNTI